MGFFGPNIKKMKANRDWDSLIKIAEESNKSSEYIDLFKTLADSGDHDVQLALMGIVLFHSHWLDESVDKNMHISKYLQDPVISYHLMKRFHAMEALEPHVDNIFTEIVTELNKPNLETNVHQALINFLGCSRDREALIILTQILSSGTRGMKIFASGSLGRIGSPDAIEPLIQLFKEEAYQVSEKTGERDALGMMIIDALGKIRDQRAIPFLKSLEASNDTNFKEKAMLALQQIPGAEKHDSKALST